MSDKLATAKDFLEDGDDFEIYTDKKGRKLKLGPIPFDEMSMESHYIVEKMIANKGLDPRKSEDREKFEEELSETERVERHKIRVNDIRNNVCNSIVNVNFVNKKQKDCVEDEVSVYRFRSVELGVISRLIDKMSNSDVDVMSIEAEETESEENSEG